MRNAATIPTKFPGPLTKMSRTSLVSLQNQVRYPVLIAGLWSMPIGLYLVSIPQQIVFASMLCAAVVSCGLILFKPKAALVALPFFTLLSPVAGFLDFFDARFLLSDLLFAFLGIQVLLLIYKTRHKPRSS